MTDRKNMSIMELAYQILFEHERAMSFNEIFDMICHEKEINEEEKAEMISQVYTDFIASAKFIYVGDDEWDIKGRRAIDLWDKDGAYYDEYPDYEEELNLFEDENERELDEYTIEEDFEEEEEEDDNIYEDDFDEDDIEDDDSEYDEFEEDDEDYIEDEEVLVLYEDDEFDKKDADDEEEIEEEEVEEEIVYEDDEDFDDEEYNEYMDDYENMYED